MHDLAVDVSHGTVTVGLDPGSCTWEDVVERLNARGFAAGEPAAATRTP